MALPPSLALFPAVALSPVVPPIVVLPSAVAVPWLWHCPGLRHCHWLWLCHRLWLHPQLWLHTTTSTTSTTSTITIPSPGLRLSPRLWLCPTGDCYRDLPDWPGVEGHLVLVEILSIGVRRRALEDLLIHEAPGELVLELPAVPLADAPLTSATSLLPSQSAQMPQASTLLCRPPDLASAVNCTNHQSSVFVSTSTLSPATTSTWSSDPCTTKQFISSGGAQRRRAAQTINTNTEHLVATDTSVTSVRSACALKRVTRRLDDEAEAGSRALDLYAKKFNAMAAAARAKTGAACHTGSGIHETADHASLASARPRVVNVHGSIALGSGCGWVAIEASYEGT